MQRANLIREACRWGSECDRHLSAEWRLVQLQAAYCSGISVASISYRTRATGLHKQCMLLAVSECHECICPVTGDWAFMVLHVDRDSGSDCQRFAMLCLRRHTCMASRMPSRLAMRSLTSRLPQQSLRQTHVHISRSTVQISAPMFSACTTTATSTSPLQLSMLKAPTGRQMLLTSPCPYSAARQASLQNSQPMYRSSSVHQHQAVLTLMQLQLHPMHAITSLIW